MEKTVAEGGRACHVAFAPARFAGRLWGQAAGGCVRRRRADKYIHAPVNEDGQIVITMPKTLLGGKTAEELEAEDKKQRPTVANQAVYNALLANEDGTFSYYLTTEQYPKLKAAYYWLGCLRDPVTAEISQEFVTAADYTDLDENGVPWGLTVSVDAETYHSVEIWYSAVVTVAPAVMLGRYQVLCGVSGDEWAVHVTVKDADSGEVISEHDFPTRGE